MAVKKTEDSVVKKVVETIDLCNGYVKDIYDDDTVSYRRSPDSCIVRPSRIPKEFNMKMTQDMKEWRRLLRDTTLEYHQKIVMPTQYR